MSPIDADLARKKFLRIIENLKDLREIHKKGVKRYVKTRAIRKQTERLLQEAIEAACDLNSHLLVEEGAGAPQDYFEGFIKLGEHGILSTELAVQLAPAAGLRNRIVHEYEDLDHAKVFKGIGTALRLFPKYIEAVQAYVSKRT